MKTTIKDVLWEVRDKIQNKVYDADDNHMDIVDWYDVDQIITEYIEKYED